MPRRSVWNRKNEHHAARAREELAAALRPGLRRALVNDFDPYPDALIAAVGRAGGSEHVSEEQLRYLRAFSYGLTSEMVAEAYGVSVNTVKSVMQLARANLMAKNTTHAVAVAIREGLL